MRDGRVEMWEERCAHMFHWLARNYELQPAGVDGFLIDHGPCEVSSDGAFERLAWWAAVSGFNFYMGKDYDRLEDEGSTERKLFCLGDGGSEKRTAGYTKLVHSAAWMIPRKLSSLLAFICLWNMWRAEKFQILYVREDVEACYTVQSPPFPF